MRGVILGECSQHITREFRNLGFEVYSCDLKPGRINQEWHLQGDWNDIAFKREWDFAIIHPVCTEVALSGNRFYGTGKAYNFLRIKKKEETALLWERLKKHVPRAVLEQPMNCLDQKRMGTRQIIHPHMFGCPEFKETWLYLHNVDPLVATNQLQVPAKYTREHDNWSIVHRETPGPDRAERRSDTRIEIARAMAEQWSKYLCQPEN